MQSIETPGEGLAISVIVCTHNPRPDLLQRALAALRSQTLPKASWELVVIDNASRDPLASALDLSWHPDARCVREEELGLTPARLRGIEVSRAPLLVFVDDDNVLAENYLEAAARIAREYPFLGALGGTIVPEFEVEPEEWTRPHWPKLAIREVRTVRWSNFLGDIQDVPCGAGMCVRRGVAEEYSRALVEDRLRRGLGRKGGSLVSGEDTDLALCACDWGLGMGLFPELSLIHIIPAFRLSEQYLIRLIEAMQYSGTLLRARRGERFESDRRSFLRTTLGRMRRSLLMKRRDRLFQEARLDGYWRAVRELEEGGRDR